MREFCKPAEFPDPDVYIPGCLPWVLAAGSPYYPELFGGIEPAARALELWMSRASSEVSVRRSHVLMSGSEVAGGFIALGGAELKITRKADAVALPKTVGSSELRPLMERMANGANLLSAVEGDEYYLSKLGLNEKFRGRGLGRPLIEKFLEDGAAQGYKRYCLEVRSDNAAAIRLYRSVGFRVDCELRSRDGRFEYFSMRLQRG